MDVQYSDPPMRIAARAALFFAPGEPLGVQEVMLAEPGPLDVVVRMPAAASPRDAPGPLGAARRVLRIQAVTLATEPELEDAIAARISRRGPSVIVARVDPSSYARISEVFRGN